MKNRVIFSVVLIVLVGSLFFSQVQAQTPPAGLDILFIVDQSGSMGGSPQHPTANDPNTLRFYAPIHAVRWLGSDRLQVHTASTFRVGVLHFGGRVQIGLDWQTIAPQDAAEWTVHKIALEQSLAFPELRQNNLGTTNFMLALQQARQMFDQLSDDPARPHRKALIILTDGEPSVEGQTPGEHMRLVQSFMADQFPAAQFTTCVIAMNDVSSDYWTAMAPYWETITQGCAVKIVSNETDVGAAFRTILRQLTQDLERPYSKQITDLSLGIPTTLVVPPYLQSISFTLDKADVEKDQIQIQVIEGDPIVWERTQIEGQGEPIETMTIYDPPPGRWEIAATPGATLQKVDMRQVGANGVLLSPQGTVPVNMPAQVIYQIQTSQGQPMPAYADPRYALVIKSQISSAGQVWPLSMRFDAAQNVYNAEFTPPQAGTYIIEISAQTQNLDNQMVTILPLSQVGSFEATALETILQSTWPPLQTLFEPRDIAFSISLAGTNLESGNLVQLVFNTGQQTWTVPLGQKSNGDWNAEFVPVVAGEYTSAIQIDHVDSAGQRSTVYEQALNPFTVVAPGVTLKTSAATQYCTCDIEMSIDNGQGNVLTAPEGYALAVAARLPDGDNVPLSTVDGRVFRGQVRFVDAGEQIIQVIMTTRAPSGQVWQTFAGPAGTVEPSPSSGLYLRIVEPAANARITASSYGFKAMPITVTLVLEDESGHQVPIDAALNELDEPFLITVVDAKSNPQSIETVWQETSNGQIQYIVRGLKEGQYDLIAQVNSSLKCGYHLLAPVQVSQPIQLVLSPTMIAASIGGVLLLLAILAGVVVFIVNDRKRQAHPCRGRVVIVDEKTGVHVFSVSFPSGKHRRNHFVYTGKKLGAKAQGYISRIEFTCNNKDESENKIVHARIWDLAGTEVLTAELRPPKGTGSARRKIIKQLWVYKDPVEL